MEVLVTWVPVIPMALVTWVLVTPMALVTRVLVTPMVLVMALLVLVMPLLVLVMLRLAMMLRLAAMPRRVMLRVGGPVLVIPLVVVIWALVLEIPMVRVVMTRNDLLMMRCLPDSVGGSLVRMVQMDLRLQWTSMMMRGCRRWVMTDRLIVMRCLRRLVSKTMRVSGLQVVTTMVIAVSCRSTKKARAALRVV